MLRDKTGSMVSRFVVIATLAIVVRVLALLLVAHPEISQGDFRFTHDEKQYHAIGATLAEHGRYAVSAAGPPSALRPPGIVLPIAGLYRVLRPEPLIAIGYVILCSVLLILVLGALAEITHGGATVVTLAMVVAAVLPTFVFTSSGIWSDPPAVLFMMAALYFTLRPANVRQADVLWPLAALALSLTYLNRPSGALVVALILPVLGLKSLFSRRFARLSFMVLCAAGPVFAWGLRNQSALGSFFIGNTMSGYAFFTGTNAVTAGVQKPVISEHNGYDLQAEAARGEYLGSAVIPPYVTTEALPAAVEADELARNAWYNERVSRFVRENPAAYLRLLGHRFIRLLTAEPMAPSVLGEDPRLHRAKYWLTRLERWFVLAFGASGIAWLYRRRHPHRHMYLLFLVGNLAIFGVAWVNARTFMPTAAVLIVPAAIAMDALARRWQSGKALDRS